MATFTPPEASPEHCLDEEALIKESRQVQRRRWRLQASVAVIALAAAGLIAFGVHEVTTSSSASSTNFTATGSCSNISLKLLGADSIPGAATTAGILVKANVSSTTTCQLKGFPLVNLMLADGSSVPAANIRSGIFGGMPPQSNANATLHNFKITDRPRTMSFTIAWTSGNGGGRCPNIAGVRFMMPHSRQAMTFRSDYEGGVGMTKFLGVYCGHVSVTPAVAGATGKFGG